MEIATKMKTYKYKMTNIRNYIYINRNLIYENYTNNTYVI